MSNGKGSARRPAAVSEQDQRDRWAQTFGRALDKADALPETASHAGPESGTANSGT